MKLLIATHHRFELWVAPEWFGERLQRDFPRLEVVQLPNYERLSQEIEQAEIFVGWSLRAEQFRAARKLRWIHSTAAAVHQLMLPEVIAGDVVVTNARGVHGPVVAEHALALMLALAKRLPSAMRYQTERHWGQEALWREQPPPRELRDSTLVLVGLGSIGSEVGRRAKAFGMRLVAVREHPERGAEAADEVVRFDQLARVLPQADVVVLAAPLTAVSKAMIGDAELELMKRDAYLINVSRGGLIDEAALAQALAQRRIAGAALDVFSAEPLAEESPFWKLENCLITPHSAALTQNLWERHYVLLADNLRRYLDGQPLLGVVDKARGY